MLQEKDGLGEATITQARTYFRRWSLAPWHQEERYFKSTTLLDKETVAHLRGLVAT